VGCHGALSTEGVLRVKPTDVFIFSNIKKKFYLTLSFVEVVRENHIFY